MKAVTKLMLFCLVLVFLGMSVFAQNKDEEKTVTDTTLEKADAPVKKPLHILLAMEKTKFKKKLTASMQALLEKKSIQVTVLKNHKKEIEDISAKDFDAVFITNSGVNSKVRPWIMEWLEKNKDYSDKILLHTTQTRDWEVKVSVDAVTSASLKKNIDQTAREYVDLLLEKLKTE